MNNKNEYNKSFRKENNRKNIYNKTPHKSLYINSLYSNILLFI
ncbi:hypothetical protein EZS27_027623 [termite gut metagenome]|uniref:Uncharacterized protein n=1 Tax=termite gut metagenome TaxID=433724 RepID=A0A5J4QPB4_9ZZZZ